MQAAINRASPSSLKKTGYVCHPFFATVHGGQHDTKFVTFELLLYAAFVSDEIFFLGYMIEPARRAEVAFCGCDARRVRRTAWMDGVDAFGSRVVGHTHTFLILRIKYTRYTIYLRRGEEGERG